jgi:hypothetical protein
LFNNSNIKSSQNAGSVFVKTASHSKNVKEYQAVAAIWSMKLNFFNLGERATCSSFAKMGHIAFKMNHSQRHRQAFDFLNLMHCACNSQIFIKICKSIRVEFFGGCWCASGAKRGVAGWGLGSHDNATTAHTLKTTLMTLACCQRFSDTFSTTNVHRMQHTAELERGRAASQRWPIQFGTNSSRGNRTQSTHIPV